MPNKGNYVNFALAADLHANTLRQLQASLNNATETQRNSVLKYFKDRISRQSTNINNRMNRLGITVIRFRRGTPEYYSLAANLALAKAKN